MSLKSASPLDLNGNDLTLELSTKFHSEKIMESDNRVELESKIKEVLATSLKVSTVIKALDIKPVMEKNTPPPSPIETEHDIQKSETNIDEALEIFGGEIVE